MSLKIKDRAKPAVPPVEPGVYMAACVGVVDLGEQYSDKFKNYSNKVMLTFELLGETVEIDGEQKPRQISKIFAFAMGAKSGLRKFLQSWDGKTLSDEQTAEEDLSQRLGRTCQLQIVLNETGDKANIDNIMAVPRGIQLAKPQSEMILFDLDEFDQATFDKLSEWTQETIQKSSQWQKNHASTEEIQVVAPAGGGQSTGTPPHPSASQPPSPQGEGLRADPETGEVIGGPSGTPAPTVGGRQSAAPAWKPLEDGLPHDENGKVVFPF